MSEKCTIQVEGMSLSTAALHGEDELDSAMRRLRMLRFERVLQANMRLTASLGRPFGTPVRAKEIQ